MPGTRTQWFAALIGGAVGLLEAVLFVDGCLWTAVVLEAMARLLPAGRRDLFDQ